MNNYKTKVCQRCGKEYTPTVGSQKYCKECGCDVENERHAKWNKANPEKVRETHAKWQKANLEKVHERGANYQKANPEKHRAKQAKYRKANLEKVRERVAKWRTNNPEKEREEHANYRKANPGEHALQEAKRRSLKYANTPLDQILTPAEWLAILAEHHGRCHYCSKKAKLTLDHIIPVSKGGKHSKDNVIPACSHCNSSKGAKPVEQWFVLGGAS